MIKDFEGIWVSREILDLEDLNLREKIVLAMKDNNIEWKNYKELGDFLGVKTDTAYRIVSKLQNIGYLEVARLNKDEIVESLKNKTNNNSIGERECEWCKTKTLVLHMHHHPIPKREGGTDIVNICPNCHHEFHYLENQSRVVK